MARPLSLAHLTVLDLSPPEVVSVAAEAGFDAFGLRLNPVRPGEAPPPVLGDTPMRRDILARMQDTGVKMLDVEAFMLREARDLDTVVPALEAGATLGASNALVMIDQADESKAVDLFAAFCDVCVDFRLTAALEFMPWIGLRTLSSAIAVERRAARSNAAILLDAFHLFRTDADLSLIAEIPREKLTYAQLCDAPATPPPSLDEIADEARFDRKFPGEGGFPLSAYIKALPSDLPIAVEVATARIAATTSPRQRAHHAYATAKALLDTV